MSFVFRKFIICFSSGYDISSCGSNTQIIGFTTGGEGKNIILSKYSGIEPHEVPELKKEGYTVIGNPEEAELIVKAN